MKPEPVRKTLKSLSWEVLPHATYRIWILGSIYLHRWVRTCWTALWFIRRCEKMARWMVRSKRWRFLLTWYSQIVRKMERIYNKRWWILLDFLFDFYHYFEITIFGIKIPYFIFVHVRVYGNRYLLLLLVCASLTFDISIVSYYCCFVFLWHPCGSFYLFQYLREFRE